VVSDNSSMKVELVHHDEASSRVSGIVLWENVSTTLDVESNLMGDRAVSNLHLVAYLIQWSKVTLNGNVRIQPDLQDCEGHLLQENLVLGKNIEIKTLPQLDIRSHNVRASHGARIEGMDEKKLFYLMSRGISLWEAKRLLIDGSLHQLFQHLDDERSWVLKNDLLERIVKG
jgi:Fe-S cluster assembly protein SufD